jgi:predicted aspartyl protease
LNGRVDESFRALVDLPIRCSESETPTVVTVWIDTAFNGFLVFPQNLIEKLGSIKKLLQRPSWRMAIV